MTVFTLHPFDQTHPDVAITGTLTREEHRLAISYTLSGHLNQVLIPPQSVRPRRMYDLWEATCFEFFLGQPDQSQYWEFNLSPTGNWNVFQLDAYRQGLQEVEGIKALPFHVHRQPTAVVLSFTFDLTLIMSPPPALDVGISAVIQSPRLPLTFWALCHPASEPDFHRRDSFILAV